MSFARLLVLLVVAVSASSSFAQTENYDPPESATPVIVTQKPPTLLDERDQADGLTVKGLTLAGSMPDDNGGTLAVYAVTSEQPDVLAKVTGVAIVVARKDGPAARAYVDADRIDTLIAVITRLAAMDRTVTPMQESRGIFRLGNLAVLNVDDNGGRIAIVRTLAVSPITGQATFAVARFRANRLNELVRYLHIAKDTLAKK